VFTSLTAADAEEEKAKRFAILSWRVGEFVMLVKAVFEFEGLGDCPGLIWFWIYYSVIIEFWSACWPLWS
jgi:hypothetical protein